MKKKKKKEMNKTSGVDDWQHGSDDQKCSDNNRDRELFAINLFYIYIYIYILIFCTGRFLFSSRYVRYLPVYLV